MYPFLSLIYHPAWHVHQNLRSTRAALRDPLFFQIAAQAVRQVGSLLSLITSSSFSSPCWEKNNPAAQRAHLQPSFFLFLFLTLCLSLSSLITQSLCLFLLLSISTHHSGTLQKAYFVQRQCITELQSNGLLMVFDALLEMCCKELEENLCANIV